MERDRNRKRPIIESIVIVWKRETQSECRGEPQLGVKFSFMDEEVLTDQGRLDRQRCVQWEVSKQRETV